MILRGEESDTLQQVKDLLFRHWYVVIYRGSLVHLENREPLGEELICCPIFWVARINR